MRHKMDYEEKNCKIAQVLMYALVFISASISKLTRV